MGCPIFRELEEKFRIAESRWAQYAFPQKTPEGTSDARAQAIAEESKRQMSELSQKISAHCHQCPICNPTHH
jgi:formylmethanofuran:tetrahydromethanopterin formyltransferase